MTVQSATAPGKKSLKMGLVGAAVLLLAAAAGSAALVAYKGTQVKQIEVQRDITMNYLKEKAGPYQLDAEYHADFQGGTYGKNVYLVTVTDTVMAATVKKQRLMKDAALRKDLAPKTIEEIQAVHAFAPSEFDLKAPTTDYYVDPRAPRDMVVFYDKASHHAVVYSKSS